MSLKNKIIKSSGKSKIYPPSSPKFDSQNWDKAFKEIKDPSENDISIYEAGLFFNQLFTILRKNVHELYENTPKGLTNHKMILLLSAIANEQFSVVIDKLLNSAMNTKNLNNLSIQSDLTNDSFNINEARESSIDSIAIALSMYYKRPKDLTGSSTTPLDDLKYIFCEYMLSQLYSSYESYWQAILYADYTFTKNCNTYVIKRLSTENEIAITYNQIRKEKRSRQNIFYIQENIERELSNLPDSLKIIYKDKQTIKVKRLNSTNPDTVGIYLYYMTEFNDCFSQLSSDFLSNEDHELSLNDIFKVFVQLSIYMSETNYAKQIPVKNHIHNTKTLLSHLPRINLTQLTKALSTSLNIEYQTIAKILKFLSFDSGKDLWGHPLIAIEKNDIRLLAPPLLSPNITRLIEYWASVLCKEIDKKGYTFEKNVIEDINQILKKNTLLKNYDPAITKTINLNIDKLNKKEQIDLLIRLGDKVLIAEIKSIIVSDSVIRHYNARQTLEHAAKQVSRKSAYIQKNLKMTFEQLGWDFDIEANYEIIPFIINSNSFHAGFVIDEIPIIDHKMLYAYFKSNKSPIISKSPTNHLAWYELYDDFETLKNNFQKYLLDPPQITLNRDDKTTDSPRERLELEEGVVIQTIDFKINELTLLELITKQRSFKTKLNCTIDEIVDLISREETKLI